MLAQAEADPCPGRNRVRGPQEHPAVIQTLLFPCQDFLATAFASGEKNKKTKKPRHSNPCLLQSEGQHSQTQVFLL